MITVNDLIQVTSWLRLAKKDLAVPHQIKVWHTHMWHSTCRFTDSSAVVPEVSIMGHEKPSRHNDEKLSETDLDDEFEIQPRRISGDHSPGYSEDLQEYTVREMINNELDTESVVGNYVMDSVVSANAYVLTMDKWPDSKKHVEYHCESDRETFASSLVPLYDWLIRPMVVAALTYIKYLHIPDCIYSDHESPHFGKLRNDGDSTAVETVWRWLGGTVEVHDDVPVTFPQRVVLHVWSMQPAMAAMYRHWLSKWVKEHNNV
jgi:hypothetical protein